MGEIRAPRFQPNGFGAESLGISPDHTGRTALEELGERFSRGNCHASGPGLPALTLNPHPLDCRPNKRWGTLKTFWIAKVGHPPRFRYAIVLYSTPHLKGVIGIYLRYETVVKLSSSQLMALVESSQERRLKNALVLPEIQVLLDAVATPSKLGPRADSRMRSLLPKLLPNPMKSLRRISELNTQAEEQAKSAELSRQKADSEALFAFNAKRACEEHSTAIASLKGTVEAEANLIVTNKQKSDELLASVNASKATIASDQTTIADKRREVEQSAAAIVKAAEAGAARLSEVETSRVSAETALKETIEAQKGAVAAQTAAAAAQKAATDARTASDEATKQAEAFAIQSEF